MATRKLKKGVLPSKPLLKGVQGTVHISPSTPLPAALKRIDKRLLKGKTRVIGMGRAIQVVLQVAASLKTSSYQVEIRTLTLTAIDETINEEKGKSTMEERPVAAVELTVQRPKI